MRPTFWIAAAAAIVLFSTSVANAQFHGGFSQRHGVAFQVRNGPQSSFTYVATSSGFGFGPIYGSMGYYGPAVYPMYGNPYFSQPPIVIQNIVQSPAALPLAPRGAAIPPEFDPPAGKAPPKGPKLGPAPRPPEVAPAEPPKPMPPLGRADADRIADAGRKAYAEGQYGRALELFRKAVEITPTEPSAHYLVSQALFAIGKYRDAIAAIAAGMALRADWSSARFASRDLYWKDPAVFDEHLNALRQAVAAFPEDANLLFLLGHQLWFDGKQDEAMALMLKVRNIGKPPTLAHAFLAK